MGQFYLVQQIVRNELFVVDRFGHAKSFIVNNPWYQFLQYLDKYSQVFISSETNIIGKQDYLVLIIFLVV